jgi:hypothetical protein
LCDVKSDVMRSFAFERGIYRLQGSLSN